MAGFVEALGAGAGVAEPLQMTVVATDGKRLYAARYASGQMVNTLYYSADMESLRQLYPVQERFAHFGTEARAVVSEQLVALPGLWHEVPAGSALTVEKGRVDQVPFTPRPPAWQSTVRLVGGQLPDLAEQVTGSLAPAACLRSPPRGAAAARSGV